jgi:threonine dehydratase
VDEIVTVSDARILDAAVALLRRRHLIAEPAGALALAAVRSGGVAAGDTAIIVSGGNASAEILAQMLQRVGHLETSARDRAVRDIQQYPEPAEP